MLLYTSRKNKVPFGYITTINRNTLCQFYGIMIDVDASQKSNAGYRQYFKYKKQFECTIDQSKLGLVNIQFGTGSATSVGSILVSNSIGKIEFHILHIDIPFLLSLKNMKSLDVF